ncbi:MAG: FAD-dependent oxidoreductase [Burkholderiaceae bacterium]|nr:FAD-dependent oxidoreductase [Burkholderiaceae bacterium]
MHSTYTYPTLPYRKPAELASGNASRHAVVVVGGGPVGLAAAIDCAQRGLEVLLLDDDNTVSVGSRGLCYAKRTLEVLDRLGCGQPLVDKGVTWNVGRTFHGDGEVYNFNLLPEADHQRPGMINLQQYYLEEYLVQRADAQPGLELRWKNKVVGVAPDDAGVTLEVETEDGRYRVHADWLIVADGARSSVRRMLGLDIQGKIFQDRFLIADVVMKADFPAERWFWFDPPFHPGQSVLLHREADNVWRIDFQLGWDADPDVEKQPARVIPRIQAMLAHRRDQAGVSQGGQSAPDFELEWVSVYTFTCRCMESFRHGRVLFVGDAAHQVSPFGARGANSGIQDSDNLAWKLALVAGGKAPAALLDTYSEERVAAAKENLLNSTRSTDFITPKSNVSRCFRNAVLTLAGKHAFARMLVNSGRLSVPTFLTASRLNTPDGDAFDGHMAPGAPMDDAPVRAGGRDDWLLRHAGGRFALMLFADDAAALDAATLADLTTLAQGPLGVATLVVAPRAGAVPRGAPEGTTVIEDVKGLVRRRYDARVGTAYLLRPDQHVAARWRSLRAPAVQAALARATCNH